MFQSNSLKLKSVKNFLRGFLPSRNVFLVGLIFYILGMAFAYLEPQVARSIFNGGFLLGNIDAKIQYSPPISLEYILNQFVYYLGGVSLNLFLNNLFLSLLCIFTGVAIVPILLVGFFGSIGAITCLLVGKVGIFKAFLILSGSFHIYFEFLAALLTIEAFLKYYGSFIRSIRIKSPQKFKKDILKEFLPILLRIMVLLAFAAVLEVFWSTWWVYILTQHYVSWNDFYLGIYSSIIH
jgi:hypothetical protein